MVGGSVDVPPSLLPINHRVPNLISLVLLLCIARYTQDNSHGLASLKRADKARALLVQAAAQRVGGIGAAVVTVTKLDSGQAEITGWGDNGG
jgi:hypothetical protein